MINTIKAIYNLYLHVSYVVTKKSKVLDHIVPIQYSNTMRYFGLLIFLYSLLKTKKNQIIEH